MLFPQLYRHKKSVRFVLVTYLTFLAFELAIPVKISNFEAHADMNITHLTDNRSLHTIVKETVKNRRCL